MAGKQTYDGNTDPGICVGVSSSSLVGFYGQSGVDQAATIAAVATTAATSTTLAFGYSTSTQADAIVTSLNSVITALKDIGIVAT